MANPFSRANISSLESSYYSEDEKQIAKQYESLRKQVDSCIKENREVRESSEALIAEISGHVRDSGNQIDPASQMVHREEEFKSGEQLPHPVPESNPGEDTALQNDQEQQSVARRIVYNLKRVSRDVSHPSSISEVDEPKSVSNHSASVSGNSKSVKSKTSTT